MFEIRRRNILRHAAKRRVSRKHKRFKIARKPGSVESSDQTEAADST